jgi:hypothetical protein
VIIFVFDSTVYPAFIINYYLAAIDCNVEELYLGNVFAIQIQYSQVNHMSSA